MLGSPSVDMQHTGQGWKSCTKCNLRFDSRDHLQRHYQWVHLNERYSCDLCSSLFKYPRSLVAHQKSERHRQAKIMHQLLQHRPINPKEQIPCPGCNQFFDFKNLEQHFKMIHLSSKMKLSKEELVVLEGEFSKGQYSSLNESRSLASKLGLTETQVSNVISKQ